MKLWHHLLMLSLMYVIPAFTFDEDHLLDLNVTIVPQNTPVEELSLEQLFHKGNNALHAGKIDEAISYFTQATKKEESSPQLFFNLGIAYERKGEIDHAIEAYKDAILLRSNYPKVHQQLAQLLQRKGALDEAITHYQHAANLDHTLIDVHITVARLLCERERFAEALPYFERSVTARPHDVQLKFEYANTLTTCNKNEDALQYYQELLKLRPHDSVILYNTAFTLKKLGRVTDAMPYYQAALAQNPNHTEAKFSLGLAHLTIGDFNQGWPYYEYRWKRNAQLAPRNFLKPQWDGTPLHDRTILIHAEQGLGDTFQFIRYVQKIRNEHPYCHIICAVQTPLKTIISRCCPFIERVVTLAEIPSSFDCHIPLMSLPLMCKTEIDTIPRTIPYIFPEESVVAHWKKELAQDTNFKVGICFQGNSNYSTPFLRAAVAAKSFSVQTFAPLATLEGVTLYCLQKQTGTDQLKQLSPELNLHIFDDTFDTTHGRFMDTAAVMKNLDLVITVDTSIAHLSAAIGTPTWILLPEPADWRWMLNRSDSPWYPSVRLFRQPKSGDWDSVMQTVTAELAKEITQHHLSAQPLSPSAPLLPGLTQQLLIACTAALKQSDPTDSKTMLDTLRRAHQLYKLIKIIQTIEGEQI